MLEVTVYRKRGYQTFQMQVRLPGCTRLTPAAARGALEVAFGQSYGGVVVGDEGYGYRVYEKSARKFYPERE